MDYKKLQNGSDIRGVALEGIEGQHVNLTEQACRDIGRGFAMGLVKKTGKKENIRVAVGRDSRLSGEALCGWICDAMVAQGIQVTNFGMASTPAMFMATVTEGYAYDGTVMITASHLPFNRNGFKFFTAGGDLEKGDIKEILTYAEGTEKTGLPGIGVPAITGSEVLEEFVGHFINQATKANILDDNSMPLFNTAEGLEAVKFIEALVPYFQTSPTEYGRGELRALVRDGLVGMIIDGPWAVPGFTSAFGEDLTQAAVGVAYMPVGPNGEQICWAGTNGWIATHEETAEASAKFIEYLMSPEVLEAHHIAYGSAPLYESEFENPAFQQEHWKVFYDTANNWALYGMIGRNSATPAAYYTAIEEVWQQLVLGTMDAETAIAAAAAAVEGITARNQ